MTMPNSKQSTDRVADVVRAHFLFRGWPDDAIRLVSSIAAVQAWRKNDLLFTDGDDCGHLMVLLEGRIQMFRTRPDGSDVTLHVVGPGALVGCAALFMGQRYPASARALSPQTTLLLVNGGRFLRLLDERPDLSRRMIVALAMRLGELADRIQRRESLSAPAQVAAWILEQPSSADARHQRCIVIPGTKKALAATLGMKPETLSRSLRTLSDTGLLRVQHATLTVLDAEGLMRAADEEK